MTRTIVWKLLQALPVLLLASLLSFVLIDLVPGDPTVQILGPDATPDQYAALRVQLGLDRPFLERYASWLGNIMTGNLGESARPPHRAVSEILAQRLPPTLQLTLMSLVFSLAVAVPLALRSAYRPGDAVDRTITGVTFASVSVPSFLGGLVLTFVVVFHPGIIRTMVALGGAGVVGVIITSGVRRRGRPRALARSMLAAAAVAAAVTAAVVLMPRFPNQGFARISEDGLLEHLRTMVLPVVTLSIGEIAVFSRLLRSDLIHTLGEDFILAARATGMRPWRIVVGEALRPSLFSLVTVVSVSLGRVIGGSVIVETLFNIPGMGQLIVDSINNKDYPIIQVCVLMIALLYVASSFLVDIAYGVLDPRVRRGNL